LITSGFLSFLKQTKKQTILKKKCFFLVFVIKFCK
ncbi:unnamed protein product, partial [Staurois parvus]